MGCIESGAETTIVRLTYESGQAGASVLTPTDLTALIRDPLLRSTGALSGLFHRGIVVGESDHDRAFYEEVNRRLRESDRGASDTFFTNAQNWQTIPRVVAPLRHLGVPAAAIIDLDTLTGLKAEWQKFYGAMALSETEANALEKKRARAATLLKALGKTAVKKKGFAGLPTGDQKVVRDLIADLEARGIFVVPVGELECWLPTLGGGVSNKAKWIVRIFQSLGSNPSAPSYVRPTNGDVWAFVDRVASWITDPNRKGLPS
jgi:hypothetical protein